MAGSKVPNDPTVSPEMRRFLDERAKAETKLEERVTTLETSVEGLGTYASDAEALAGTEEEKIISPATLAYVLDNRTGQQLHVQDQKSAGTDGGTLGGSAWTTRDLNTIVGTNSIAGASLSTNQITLPAGTYMIWASAPGYHVDNHQVRWRNVTDGATVLVGAGSKSNHGAVAVFYQTRSLLQGVFTIAATKAFELQHWASSGSASTGLGIAVNSGEVEVYADCLIMKVG